MKGFRALSGIPDSDRVVPACARKLTFGKNGDLANRILVAYESFQETPGLRVPDLDRFVFWGACYFAATKNYEAENDTFVSLAVRSPKPK